MEPKGYNTKEDKINLSLVSPMFNEEAIIAVSIKRLVNALNVTNKNWELILINDGSTDDTFNEAKKASKKDRRIKIISYQKNMGRGYAIRQGFNIAQGDIIITTESDLSWGESIIQRLVYTIETSEAEVILASPHLVNGGYKKVPLHRALLSALGNKILGLAFGNKLTMTTGMTRAYRRKVIDTLNLESNGKELHLEIISKALALNYKIKEIPAVISWVNKLSNRKKRRKSNFNFKRILLSHLIFSFNESPVILLGTISAFFILLSLTIFLYLFYTWINAHLNPIRPLMYVALVLLITGIQIILFSFLSYQNKDLKKQAIIIQREVLELKKGIHR